MSSLLQSTGSSQYVLVHIVGPLAATTSLLFKERFDWGTVDREWQPVWRVASGER